MDLIPANLVATMAQEQVLPVLLFALLLGITLRNSGERGASVRAFVWSASELMFDLIRRVLRFTLLGVFGLIAWVTGQYGLAVLLPLGSTINMDGCGGIYPAIAAIFIA